MSQLGTILRSIRTLFRLERADRELDEELRFYLERQVEINIAAGMEPENARYSALRSFGGVDQVKEDCRDARRFGFLDILRQDVRFAVRLLFKNRGVTAIAILSLGLGIGANAELR
jgi:hypothetical protein